MPPIVALAELAGMPARAVAADVRAAARGVLDDFCTVPLAGDGAAESDPIRFHVFQADDAEAPGKFWAAVMLMAVRDGAESLCFRPHRAECRVNYVVAGTTYELVPPPVWLAAGIFDFARTRFAGVGWGGPLTRLGRIARRGRPNADCAAVAFELAGHLLLWNAVAWSTGERSGVDLYRVAPVATL